MAKRYSGIGGQAVMEGVMMRNKNVYALAVRLPDHTINVTTHREKTNMEMWNRIPVVRGVVSFFHSLILGLKTLTESASYFEEEEERKKKQSMTEEERKAAEKKEKAEMGGTLLLSFVLALGIFFVLPFFTAKWLANFIGSPQLLALIEGVFRVSIFLLYITLISKMEDIKRVFMYHGAEHKCINCIEHGMPLNVENVRKSSRQHKRCGTSFIFFVFVISILVFMFIRMESPLLQMGCRLLLIPVIAGLSFEFIRLAGRTENPVINALSKPGLWIQNMTTAEPDDEMIEVGIASVEAVFDWKKFQEENKDAFCEITGR